MNMRQIVGAFLTALLFGCRAAFAEGCVIKGPRYILAADAVSWSMKIESGHHCIRGIRFANVEFEGVTLISQPQFGQIVLQGSGFTYTPKDDFRGEDSFALRVSGKIRKIRGASTIHILVSIVGPDA
jgi:Bacterial Ig domain